MHDAVHISHAKQALSTSGGNRALRLALSRKRGWRAQAHRDPRAASPVDFYCGLDRRDHAAELNNGVVTLEVDKAATVLFEDWFDQFLA